MSILIVGRNGFIGNLLVTNLKQYDWIYIERNDNHYLNEKFIFEKDFLHDEILFDFDTFILTIGSGNFKYFLDITEDELNKSYNDNFNKPFIYLQAVSKYFKKRGKGNIIVINSLSAININKYGATYCSFKSALSMLVKVIRKELKEYRIKISQIYLPPINSPMTDMLPEKIDSGYLDKKEVLSIINDTIKNCNNRDITVKTKIKCR
ncbi:SDR family oxidoreductase [candidate division WOR-3 bacterium]|nr:SDR family oxidoreductase [candidate division WOR-3 bacterium]